MKMPAGNKLRKLIWLAVAACVSVCASAAGYEGLVVELERYVSSKDARIGVAVIVDGRDTVSVGAGECYPMLSVYKFPQALAVARYADFAGLSLTDTVDIAASEMRADTWSPMRDRYGAGGCRLPLYEILEYSLAQSDNNACDVLFRLIGGPRTVMRYLDSIGFVGGINVVDTEASMHADVMRCYDNCAEPVAMARLADRFGSVMCYDGEWMGAIARMMENCKTGIDRLPGPLMATGAVIGHKTGTGDSNAQGRIIGVNDVGYVRLPGGRRYAVAVFISDSVYDLNTTSAMIGDISTIIVEYLRPSGD